MRRVVTAAFVSVQRAAGRLWTRWREFWFKPADPTPLAVMRILFGGMLFYTHLVWGLNLEGFFGPNGWQGTDLVRAVQQDQFAWSFWWWVPDGLRLSVHLISLGVLALYTLGAFTPATSIMAYVITVSYAYRAPLANYGLDQINGIAALYLAIGPSGAVLSVDRLWQRYRASRGRPRGEKICTVPPVAQSVRANLALRLMQVQLCVIYIFACQSKLQGESWWSGQAIWRAVSNLEYQSTDLTWLAWYPWLVNLLTHATIIWEMTFWALVWRPICRPVVLLIGVFIHLGIGAFMGMWTFGLAVIFLYVAFVPAATLKAVLGSIAGLLQGRFRKIAIDPSVIVAPGLNVPDVALHFERPTASLPASDWQIRTAAISTQPVGKEVEDSQKARRRKPTTLAPPDSSTTTGELPPGYRPTLVLVESRLKRLTQIQEYMVKRGFRCFVAADLNQARSLLCVLDVDAFVVTATWFPDDELRAFRDALITGGSSLPASVFFATAMTQACAESLEESPCHRLVRVPITLRELRLRVLDVLSSQDPPAHPRETHPSGSETGNGRKPEPPESLQSPAGAVVQLAADLKIASMENGAQT